MPRKKVESTTIISNVDQADEALRQIGELVMLREIEEQKYQLAVNDAKEVFKAKAAPLDEQIKTLEVGLRLWAEGEYKAEKFISRKLIFGSVFFRKMTGLRTLPKITWKKAAEMARAAGLDKFLKVTYEVKRDELRMSEVSDAAIASAGMERYSDRIFTYEINREKFDRIDKPAVAPGASSAA